MSATAASPSSATDLLPAVHPVDDGGSAVPAVEDISVERDPKRDRWHLLPVTVAWVLAGLGWVRALGGVSRVQVLGALLVIAVSLVTCGLATAVWVWHNRRIHRLKGPRTGLPTARIEYGTDWVGRPVTTEWSFVQRAPEVVITSGGAWKVVWPARVTGRGPTPGG